VPLVRGSSENIAEGAYFGGALIAPAGSGVHTAWAEVAGLEVRTATAAVSDDLTPATVTRLAGSRAPIALGFARPNDGALILSEGGRPGEADLFFQRLACMP
jgi:hypothetical protein